MSTDPLAAAKAGYERLKRSFTVKAGAIAVLILLLLIPKASVMQVIGERQARKAEAKAEVGGKWGGAQTIAGPWLSVPFENIWKDEKGVLRSAPHRASFLPEKLKVDTVLEPEVRRRGIFEVIVYTAKLTINGSFRRPAFEGLSVRADRVAWSDANVSFGIADLRGIGAGATLIWNKRETSLDPGITGKGPAAVGIHADVAVTADEEIPFRLACTLRGAEEMYFVPGGRTTEVSARSTWNSPSFQGSFLPKERTVGKDGFSASWEVPHLARNFPQRWLDAEVDDDAVRASAFGVRLYDPVDAYQVTTRSAKYGILFLALTFLIFFLFEVLASLRVHPIQYLLVGFALLVFYVLLLALSEHLPFGGAYLIAAAATTLLVAAYSASVLTDMRRAGSIGGLLAFLYAYLYVLLKAEDYSLLIGAVGLFTMLGAVMFATRRVDWYGTKR